MRYILLTSARKREFYLTSFYSKYNGFRLVFWTLTLLLSIGFLYMHFFQSVPLKTDVIPYLALPISIYYLLQPYFWILQNRSYFNEDSNFYVEFKNKEIVVKTDSEELLIINEKSIKKLFEFDQFIKVKLARHSIFIPKADLANEELIRIRSLTAS